jgi:hypothetical protein
MIKKNILDFRRLNAEYSLEFLLLISKLDNQHLEQRLTTLVRLSKITIY